MFCLDIQDGSCCIHIEILQRISASEPHESWQEISNNVVCATSNASDQPVHTHSLIRAIASAKLLTQHHLEFLSLKGGCTGSSGSIHVKMPHCWKSHVTAQLCWIEPKLGERYPAILLPSADSRRAVVSYKQKKVSFGELTVST